MSSLNKVLLIGRVGKDPEVRRFDSGSVNASFSLATSEKYKNKSGNQVEDTEWHNITVWGRTAEIVEMYVNKGSLLFVEGKLKTRSWETDGQKKYMTEINASNITMLGSKGQDSTQPTPSSPTDQYQQAVSGASNGQPETDDLPF